MQAENECKPEDMQSDALDHMPTLQSHPSTNITANAQLCFPIPSPSPALSSPPPPSSSTPVDDGDDESSAVKNEDMEVQEELDSRDQTLPVSSSKDNNNENDLEETEDSDEGGSVHKKQKTLSSLPDSTPPPAQPSEVAATIGQQPQSGASKKSSKKKNNNVWTKSTSRKGKKKYKSTTVTRNSTVAPEDNVFVTPIPRFPDKSDDSPDAGICLSRAYKAEKVELSDDRLSAGSTKGYRMVRATRGVDDGAWYFEIKVVKLGETGHTRLGWTTEKGDLQAPVGYDGHSFGYRDIDGSKIHKALREKYGEEGYIEGDIIGFYINLPDGKLYAPKPPNLVWYKGQRYMYPADGKEEPLKIIPGSEISFFKNGVCQGVAFTDLFGGRYYPAASMYTLPNQPSCEVRFNFGPDFELFPQEFGSRTIPRPMSELPYHGYDGRAEGAAENGLTEKND